MSINWQQAPIDDRGLAFGDGCFETLRIAQGQAPFWPQHKQRLLTGLTRLGISACAQTLDQILKEACQNTTHGILKIIVTRGAGGRGYDGSHLNQPHYYPRTFPYTPLPRERYAQGMVVGESRVQLSAQPLLAGIKHLNRLEQVLARHEAAEHGWHEALLRDGHDQPVELSAMNLFLRAGKQWWTSSLTHAGVKGVARQWVLEQLSPTLLVSQHLPFPETQVEEAFGCNSIMGIVPIRTLGARSLTVGDETLGLQQQWEQLWHG